MRVARAEGEPEWEMVVGDRFVVALPIPPAADDPAAADPTVTDAAASALLDAVSASRVEQVVSRIPLGEDGVEGFALVWWPPGGGRVTAVVRGAAVVELSTADGPRTLEARGIRPWHLAEFGGVHSIRIGAPVDGRAGWMEVAAAPRGQRMRGSRVEWTAAARIAGPGDRDPAPATEPIPTRSEHLGHHPGQGSDPAAGAVDEAAVGAAWFRIDGGQMRSVTRVVLIGRRPAPPRIAREPVQLVRVPADAASVSGTHLELRLEGTRLVATDLRSTNGTIVRTASGSRRMRAGESIVVSVGAVLELGGDTIVEILPPPQDQAHPDRQVPA